MAYLKCMNFSRAQMRMLYGLGGAAVTTALIAQHRQDKRASDSYENAMTTMQINPLLKTAMRQLKGIRLEQTDEEVVMVMLSRIPWLRLQERYPWSGEAVPIRRRDFRRGKAKGALGKDADSLWIEQAWGDPVSGHGSECAWSPEPGVLYVDSTIVVKGRTAQYRQVYHLRP